MDRMTCIHGRLAGNGADNRHQPFFLQRPVVQNHIVRPPGGPGKRLAPVARPVANNATVDAGHPIHDQRRWQVALRFNFVNESVSQLI